VGAIGFGVAGYQLYQQEGRFQLVQPAWYLQNLLAEPRRYSPGLGPLGWRWLTRVGFWCAAVGLPLAVAALCLRAIHRGDAAARALVLPLIMLGLLYALLLRSKVQSYALTLVPIAALCGAWGLAELWLRAGRGRWALAALVLAIVAEGSWQIEALEAIALQSTPYEQFVSRVRAEVPAGTRVLGKTLAWFGLYDHDFRAIWVPLRWTDPDLVREPVPLDVALDRVGPDVVLVDQRLRESFGSEAGPASSADDVSSRFWGWMERRGARLLARIDDTTYGTMDVYQVTRVRSEGP